jgi:hypothetical protein
MEYLATSPAEAAMRRLYAELAVGNRVEVQHEVKVGMQTWSTTTAGTVVGKERRRHSLHFRRNLDDKVWSDVLVLRKDDGELTTVTIDEYTRLRKTASSPAAIAPPTERGGKH